MNHSAPGCELLRHDTRPRLGVADLAVEYCETCGELLFAPQSSPVRRDSQLGTGGRGLSPQPLRLPGAELVAAAVTTAGRSAG